MIKVKIIKDKSRGKLGYVVEYMGSNPILKSCVGK
jgi:hypothetical protein